MQQAIQGLQTFDKIILAVTWWGSVPISTSDDDYAVHIRTK